MKIILSLGDVIQDITDAESLEEYITHPESTVTVSAFMLLACGLSNKIRKEYLQLGFKTKKQEDFTCHEFVIGGIRKSQEMYLEETHLADESCLYGLLSGLTLNPFVKLSLEDKSWTNWQSNPYVSDVAKWIYEHQNDPNKTLLAQGLGLFSLWDFPLDKAVRPFVECFHNRLARSLLWLFFDLEDLDNYHHSPPHYPNDAKDPGSLKWRSKIEYILRNCHLCKDSIYAGGKKKVVKIIATSSSASIDESKITELKQILKNGAEQMGCKKLIDFDIIFISKEANRHTKNSPEYLQKHMNSIIRSLPMETIPLAWLFFRGYLHIHYPKWYIEYDELKEKASKFNVDVEKFCEFFESIGTLFDVRKVSLNTNYIIVKPVEFLKLLSRSFHVHKGNPKVSSSTSVPDRVMLDILVAVALALNPNQDSDCYYYIPPLRMGKDQQRRRLDSYIPGAVQVIVSIQAPRVNMTLNLANYLLNKVPSSEFVEMEEINCIGIRISNAGLTVQLASQGDVMEVRFTEVHKNVTHKELTKTCKIIVNGIKEFMMKKVQAQKSGDTSIRYHFAIPCNKEAARVETPYIPHQMRHVLPIKIDQLCAECAVEETNCKTVLDAWNKALEDPVSILLSDTWNNSLCIKKFFAMFSYNLCILPHTGCSTKDNEIKWR